MQVERVDRVCQVEVEEWCSSIEQGKGGARLGRCSTLGDIPIFESSRRIFALQLVNHRAISRVFSVSLQSLSLSSSQVCRAEVIVLRHDRSDLESGSVSSHTDTESGSDQSTSDPGGENASKVEVDRSVGPFLDLFSGVDEVLNTSGIKIGNGRKVEDDGAEQRLGLLRLVLGFSVGLGRSRVIPRSVSLGNERLVLPTTSVSLDVFDNLVVDVRGVGVKERLLESVDDDTGRGFLDRDVSVHHSTSSAERDVDISDLSGLGVLWPDSDSTKEVSFRSSDSEEEEGDRSSKRPVDTSLDRVEERPEHGTHKDEVLERGHSPEAKGLLGRSDEISDGVNDQSRQSRVRDPVESRSDGVKSDQDDDTGGDTSGRGSDSRLGLESGSREGTGRGVGREKRAEGVVDSNSDQLLVGVDLVSVQSTERFGDRDVLEKENNRGDRDVGTDSSEKLSGNVRLMNLSQTTRDRSNERDPRLFGMVEVDSPRDNGEDDDRESVSQALAEEECPRPSRVPLAEVGEGPLEEVEQEEGGETKCRIERSVRKVLERVDDHLVGGCTCVESLGQSKDGRELTGGNVDRTTSHEPRDGRLRDELDDPADSQQTDGEDDETADEGEAGGDYGCRVQITVLVLNLGDDVTRLEGHDGDRADRDVFGSGEEGIGEDTDE